MEFMLLAPCEIDGCDIAERDGRGYEDVFDAGAWVACDELVKLYEIRDGTEGKRRQGKCTWSFKHCLSE